MQKQNGLLLWCDRCKLRINSEIIIDCPRCGLSLRDAMKMDESLPEGYRLAAICRSNKCGHYVAASDACQLVIDRGKAKGQNRPGKIVWMYGNPKASCPADPPQF